MDKREDKLKQKISQILEDYQEKEKGEFAKYVKEHGSELERELLDLVFIQEKVFRDSRLLIEKLKKQNFLLQKENKRKDHSNYILTILAWVFTGAMFSAFIFSFSTWIILMKK